MSAFITPFPDCTGNEDIVDGNLKLILGLVWTLILHYQINMGFQDDTEGGGAKQSPKQALLAWIREKLPEKGIRNFTTDWNSGVNVAALVDAVSPGLCSEHATMDESNALENASLAMGRAEQWLEIPQVDQRCSKSSACLLLFICMFL